MMKDIVSILFVSICLWVSACLSPNKEVERQGSNNNETYILDIKNMTEWIDASIHAIDTQITYLIDLKDTGCISMLLNYKDVISVNSKILEFEGKEYKGTRIEFIEFFNKEDVFHVNELYLIEKEFSGETVRIVYQLYLIMPDNSCELRIYERDLKTWNLTNTFQSSNNEIEEKFKSYNLFNKCPEPIDKIGFITHFKKTDSVVIETKLILL